MNSDGSNQIDLTNNGANDEQVAWGGAMEEETFLQVGPNNGTNQIIEIVFPDARLSGNGVIVSTVDSARDAISIIDSAINKISDYRSYAGLIQKRLEHIVNDNSAAYINISAARSRIEDADIAHEITSLTKNQIMSQSTQAMAVQANSDSQIVLDLINQSM
jgi:flagellin